MKEKRILAIGDTHGRQDWKVLLEENLSTVKTIVFIGDYFDTHDDISQVDQLFNFKQILHFKRENPDKVILLIGNHDYHYMGDFKMTYSGFGSALAFDIRDELQLALKEGLIQASHIEDTETIKILFTHAGVTKTWADANLGEYDLNNISEKINELFLFKQKAFEFTCGEKYNMYGDEICQTPIWVRPDSLMSDGVSEDIVQVVGHTQQLNINQIGRFVFIDCLDRKPNEFLSLS